MSFGFDSLPHQCLSRADHRTAHFLQVSSENEREVRRAVRVEKAFADLLTRNFTLVHSRYSF